MLKENPQAAPGDNAPAHASPFSPVAIAHKALGQGCPALREMSKRHFEPNGKNRGAQQAQGRKVSKVALACARAQVLLKSSSLQPWIFGRQPCGSEAAVIGVSVLFTRVLPVRDIG